MQNKQIFAALIRDTFRQSLSYGIFWILLAVSVLTTAVCLTVHIDGAARLAAPGENADFLPKSDPDAQDSAKMKESGVVAVSGNLSLAFGAIKIPLERDSRTSVHFLQLVLAGGVADTLGLLLTLIWTAGFLPGFLEGRSLSVLLAKPVSRWQLLAGKYLGVLSFVLLHATLFVGGTWLAIAVKTGIWDASYLYAIPLLLLHFAVFFSVSLLLAVCTRSTVVSVFGSILFWCIAWGMNYGRHFMVTCERLAPEGTFSGSLSWLVDIGYWILPKPADFGMLLYDALDAKNFFGPAFDPQLLHAHGFSIWLSVLSSLAFTAYVLFASARKFMATDY